MQFFKKTTNFNFMDRRQRFLAISGVAVLLSIAATLVIGPKMGIDFMGGTEIQVKFKQQVSSAQVRGTLKKIGFNESEVVTYGQASSEYLIRLRTISPINDALAKSAEETFKQRFAANDNKVTRFEFSPGGDKLMIRMNREVGIAELEKTLADAKLNLGSVEAFRDMPTADKPAEPQGEDAEGEADTEESVQGVESQRCESATCTWPYRDERVYKVNLEGLAERVMAGLREESFGQGAVRMRSEWVGPKVGEQLRSDGVKALVFALLFIMIYIAIRFDLRFAPGAVVALVHDVLITLGIFTLVRVEVTLATISALLTIVGYSLNDTIVVFDRIRENLTKVKDTKLSRVINVSINQTLSRTVLTSLTTLIAVGIILGLGWKTSIRDFAFALMVGVLVGTYSSIFVASPIVVWLDSRLGKKRA